MNINIQPKQKNWKPVALACSIFALLGIVALSSTQEDTLSRSISNAEIALNLAANYYNQHGDSKEPVCIRKIEAGSSDKCVLGEDKESGVKLYNSYAGDRTWNGEWLGFMYGGKSAYARNGYEYVEVTFGNIVCNVDKLHRMDYDNFDLVVMPASDGCQYDAIFLGISFNKVIGKHDGDTSQSCLSIQEINSGKTESNLFCGSDIIIDNTKANLKKVQ